MRLLVDAYNVLHAWRGGPAAGGHAQLLALTDLIVRSRYRSAPTTLVCDGAGPNGRKCRVPLRAGESAMGDGTDRAALYAGAGRDADSLIERLLQKEHGRRSLTVVSSDRRLRRAAGRAKARWLSSSVFVGHLVKDAAAPRRLPARPDFARRTPLDSHAVGVWAEHLGVASDDALAGMLEDEPRLDERLQSVLRRVQRDPDGGDVDIVDRRSPAGGGVRSLGGPVAGGGPSPDGSRRVSTARSGPRRGGGASSRTGQRDGERRGDAVHEAERDAALEASMLRDLASAVRRDPTLRELLERASRGEGRR